MVMKPDSVIDLAQDILIPGLSSESGKLDRIDRWGRFQAEDFELPNFASREHKELRALAKTPWLALVVTTVAEQLVAELVRSTEVEDITSVWKPWLNNRMPSRQRAIHRAALMYGYSYATAMPGNTGAHLRGRSPRELYAVYQDVVEDEYPMYYILRRSNNGFDVVDEEAVYHLAQIDGKLTFISVEVHNVGVAPAVRYSNLIDLEGRTPGEVEPFIPLAKRINKDGYDRLLAQHFNSWKVRTATGLDVPNSEEERAKVKLLLRQEDILTGETGVEFGTLDETPLDGFISATEHDIETLAAVSQTPAHSLTGKMDNLSADAIVEARSLLDLKANERKIGFGDSHCQLLRLAAHIEGRKRDAEDFTLSMQWADLGSRSMSQAADALGKLSTQLGIPPEKLWDRIPSVTAEEAQSWLSYKEAHPDATAQLANTLSAQANGSYS